jgi:hypothetical protein
MVRPPLSYSEEENPPPVTRELVEWLRKKYPLASGIRWPGFTEQEVAFWSGRQSLIQDLEEFLRLEEEGDEEE